MSFDDEIRAAREVEKAKIAAMAGLKTELDALEIDGSEASTVAAVEHANAWLQAFDAPALDASARAAILKGAVAAIRDRAEAARGGGKPH